VEGLSVAAISYYSLGLLGYVFKAASELWKSLDPAFATGLAAPFVVVIVWGALHRVRGRMMAEDRARKNLRFAATLPHNDGDPP
jgi:uncharacterized membrane-anchored protein